ncbi:MAG: cation:proton antiporter, partial [Gemmatimonadota bacterium]
MPEFHLFLRDLAVVLGTAAVTTVVFQRLRQSVVLGYLLAGMLVGPHVPFPLVAREQTVRTFAELGVILLIFGLGLEFSFRRLLRVGAPIGLVTVIQTGLMLSLGYLTGQLLGWSALDSVFAGAIICVSSTVIIARVFDEQRITGRLRELVVGILVAEDLVAIVLIASLSAAAVGTGLA